MTRGTQPINGVEPIQMAQAPVWGLARTFRLEHPEIKCVSVDLPPQPKTEDIDALLAELALAGDEAQVAVRSGERFVARLVRSREIRKRPPDGPIRLQLTEYGTPDQLRLVPLDPPPPRCGRGGNRGQGQRLELPRSADRAGTAQGSLRSERWGSSGPRMCAWVSTARGRSWPWARA